MKTSSNCPSCGGRLNFWTALKAPTPFRLRCTHCKAALKVVLPGLWALMVVICALFILLGIGTVYAFLRHGWPYFFAGLSALLFLWLIIEIFTMIVFYNNASFVVMPGKKKA